MWRWRPDASGRWRAVPRTERSEGRGAFALVMRCRIMRLLLYSRVGKNRDTRRESPAGAGAACAASHINNLFKLENSRGTEANDIYRPVGNS
jgi:hypothetical protein